MKNIYQNIVVVVVTFLVSLLLNFLVQYFTQDRGSILIGPAITSRGQTYLPISISNFTDQPIDNLVLSVPVSTTISSIAASTAIQIEELPSTIGTSARKQIRLSGLEPSRVTKLLIPIVSQTEAEDVAVVNARQVRLNVEPTQGVQSQSSIAFQRALLNSTITIVIYVVFLLWQTGQSREMTKELEKIRSETKDWEKKLEDARSESERIRTVEFPKVQKSLRKANLLTISRLSDYARELDFWRDTIRKFMYQATGDSNVAEKLIKEITENLKTYSTLYKPSPSVDFESIQILAKYIQENEQEQDSAWPNTAS